MQEALRYFELDAMLSLKERVLNCDTSLVVYTGISLSHDLLK